MKCPKCSTIQADSNESCSRCGVSLQSIKAKRALNALVPPAKGKTALPQSSPKAEMKKLGAWRYLIMAIGFYFGYKASQMIPLPFDEKPAAVVHARSEAQAESRSSQKSAAQSEEVKFIDCVVSATKKGLTETEATMRCSSDEAEEE